MAIWSVVQHPAFAPVLTLAGILGLLLFGVRSDQVVEQATDTGATPEYMKLEHRFRRMIDDDRMKVVSRLIMCEYELDREHLTDNSPYMDFHLRMINPTVLQLRFDPNLQGHVKFMEQTFKDRLEQIQPQRGIHHPAGADFPVVLRQWLLPEIARFVAENIEENHVFDFSDVEWTVLLTDVGLWSEGEPPAHRVFFRDGTNLQFRLKE
jgi:hypothetical protein